MLIWLGSCGCIEKKFNNCNTKKADFCGLFCLFGHRGKKSGDSAGKIVKNVLREILFFVYDR